MRPTLALLAVLALNAGAFVSPLLAGAGAVGLLVLLGPELVRELAE